MAVTPVRIESPSTIVRWPTRTPGTSVIAFHFPAGRIPGRTPRSRSLGRSSPNANDPAAAASRTREKPLLLLLLILDLGLRRIASRTLQVVLEPFHHAEVVIEPVRAVAVAVPLAGIEHEPHRRFAPHLHVPVEDERLAGMHARILLAVEDQDRRARPVALVDRASLQRELPVLPRPAHGVDRRLLHRDVGRSRLGDEVADSDEYDAGREPVGVARGAPRRRVASVGPAGHSDLRLVREPRRDKSVHRVHEIVELLA